MHSRKFKDRTEAGEALARALSDMAVDDPVVLALPRGGVPVAVPVAQTLKAPLGLIMVKKIGMPGHAEYAIGAVVDGSTPHVVKNRDGFAASGLSDAEFDRLVQDKLTEIERRKKQYGASDDLSVNGRTAIVVDDGIATGASVKAAVGALRAQTPDRIVVAVPVAPRSSIAELTDLVDAVICLSQPSPFIAVGVHYRDFGQTSDATVKALMGAFGTPPQRDGGP